MYRTIAASLALALAATLSASADVITPGGATNNITSFNASGLTLLATNPATVPGSNTSGTFTATYQTGVFTDTHNVFCAGCLDFSYYIVNDNSTTSPHGIIESVSMSNFANFDTSVGVVTNGGLLPTSATRSGDGTTVKFYYGGNNLQPGQLSDYLIVQTNATSYAPGLWSIQDGQALSLQGFEPLASASAPEPSSLLLLGTGLLGVAGLARKKLGV